jgi:hypothetical protein
MRAWSGASAFSSGAGTWRMIASKSGWMSPDPSVGRRSGLLGYTVEVQFSSQIPSAFLTVANAGSGIRIIICDVNRDNDPDVVIQAATSVIPLAIWLGDGRGHFRQSNPWQYIPLRMDPPARVATDQNSHEQASILTKTRFNPAALPTEHSATHATRQNLAADAIPLLALCPFNRRNPARSPPSFS